MLCWVSSIGDFDWRILYKFGDIEILDPSCNPSTLLDGRGGIFTWIPAEAILEFNLLIFHAGKSRGNHYHPEFVEYFLVVDGLISLTTIDSNLSKISTIGGVGFCFKAPKKVPHLVRALSEAKCIALITKPWDECTVPIVYQNLE
jgi:mannose-6-phosphate isomerase-like protein (cupin superfamily)